MTPGPSGRVALLCALAGVAFYAVLAFGLTASSDAPHFGSDIYDAYFYRLTDGTGGFDLPVRLLQYEGHYTADGTGLLYHGFAPLLSRVLIAPFTALNTFPTGPFSIWLWVCIGTGFYHLALWQVARKSAPAGEDAADMAPVLWSALLGLAVWFSGPGPFLSASTSLFHEPIAITYAATALFVFLMMRCIFFDLPFSRVLIPLALLAGLVVHARPHIALGLYAGVVLAAGLMLWRQRSTGRILVAGGAMLVLLAFGLAFMQLNAARFGSPVEAHGQFADELDAGQVQYGTVYWGYEPADNPRARTFVEHGRFNPARVLPNLGLYMFDVPEAIIGAERAQQIADLHAAKTQPVAGFGRLEGPRIGIVLLWPVWFALLAAGLIFLRPPLAAVPVLVATFAGFVLMLSYPTITLRYRAELWPFLIVLCALALPGLIGFVAARGPGLRKAVLVAGVAILVPGLMLSVLTATRYTALFRVGSDPFFAVWTEDLCAGKAAEKGFAEPDIARICIDPDSLYPTSAGG